MKKHIGFSSELKQPTLILSFLNKNKCILLIICEDI